jgi:hypothetical protein
MKNTQIPKIPRTVVPRPAMKALEVLVVMKVMRVQERARVQGVLVMKVVRVQGRMRVQERTKEWGVS